MVDIGKNKALQDRIYHEREHAREIIRTGETNWGWHTDAGKLRVRRRLQFFLDGLNIDISHTIRALEIGCGSGVFTNVLGNHLPQLIAVDISLDLLTIAKRKTTRIQFLQMDAHRPTFIENCFDMVLGCSVLHHLDVEMALKAFFRILKPGGFIRFSEPNLFNPQIFLQKNVPILKKWCGDSPDEYALTQQKMKRILAKTGYKGVVIEPFEFLHPKTPSSWIPKVLYVERLLHKTSLKHLGGSLLIYARKPS